MIRVTVWNEFISERHDPRSTEIYPDGIHNAIAKNICGENITVRTATLDEPSHGLTADVLEETDVLIWWGHCAHDRVDDAVVEMVHERVLKGMGIILLHSSHMSKIMRKLMGTSCTLKWREIGEAERLWVIEPGHPIAQGLPECIDLPHEEMYSERFDIPTPESLVFVGSFSGGEVFRSGCCYTRGYGRVFYFQPGHETYPVYHNPLIVKILRNAVNWVRPTAWLDKLDCPQMPAPNQHKANESI